MLIFRIFTQQKWCKCQGTCKWLADNIIAQTMGKFGNNNVILASCNNTARKGQNLFDRKYQYHAATISLSEFNIHQGGFFCMYTLHFIKSCISLAERPEFSRNISWTQNKAHCSNHALKVKATTSNCPSQEVPLQIK